MRQKHLALILVLLIILASVVAWNLLGLDRTPTVNTPDDLLARVHENPAPVTKPEPAPPEPDEVATPDTGETPARWRTARKHPCTD